MSVCGYAVNNQNHDNHIFDTYPVFGILVLIHVRGYLELKNLNGYFDFAFRLELKLTELMSENTCVSELSKYSEEIFSSYFQFLDIILISIIIIAVWS